MTERDPQDEVLVQIGSNVNPAFAARLKELLPVLGGLGGVEVRFDVLMDNVQTSEELAADDSVMTGEDVLHDRLSLSMLAALDTYPERSGAITSTRSLLEGSNIHTLRDVLAIGKATVSKISGIGSIGVSAMQYVLSNRLPAPHDVWWRQPTPAQIANWCTDAYQIHGLVLGQGTPTHLSVGAVADMSPDELTPLLASSRHFDETTRRYEYGPDSVIAHSLSQRASQFRIAFEQARAERAASA